MKKVWKKACSLALTVAVLSSYSLTANALGEETKKYDVKLLTKKNEVFKELENKELFNKAKVDIGGYGIIWNDDLDLSSEEIWVNGIIVEEN